MTDCIFVVAKEVTYQNSYDKFTLPEWVNYEKQCMLCKVIYVDLYLFFVKTFNH